MGPDVCGRTHQRSAGAAVSPPDVLGLVVELVEDLKAPPVRGAMYRATMTCGDTFWPVWRYRAVDLLEALSTGLDRARREVGWRRRGTAGRQPPSGAELTLTVEDEDGQTTTRTLTV